ncbi:hypothetical protein NDU88_006459 [Pleurodeles waltl]|uniref:Uncharacterized protein n=1 Tax=Pleurodeles waltl TaxID=8319 RepID=A0AAV7N7A8_PLEWA|nr:hypothetical protein NDU88_006459 [Pleurodeles waltl]
MMSLSPKMEHYTYFVVYGIVHGVWKKMLAHFNEDTDMRLALDSLVPVLGLTQANNANGIPTPIGDLLEQLGIWQQEKQGASFWAIPQGNPPPLESRNLNSSSSNLIYQFGDECLL